MAKIYVLAANPRGNTYYVAPDGSNEADGSIGTPWATLTYAASQLSPGDKLYLRGGTYSERLVIPSSGTSGRWITYEAYPTETPIIDGDGATVTDSLDGVIYVSGKSYLRFKGLTIINGNTTGRYVAGICLQYSVHHIEILNNTISNMNASGIMSGSGYTSANQVNSYITIQGNEIYDCNNLVSQEALTLCNCHYCDVSDNYIHDCHKEGLDVKGESSHVDVHHNIIHDLAGPGIYIDGNPCSYINIYSNYVYDLHDNDPETPPFPAFYNHMSGIVVSSEHHVMNTYINVYNNIVDNSSMHGIEAGYTQHIRIFNNTIEKCNPGFEEGRNIQIDSVATVDNISIFNNILWRRTPHKYYAGGIRINANTVYASDCVVADGVETNTYAATVADDNTYHTVDADEGNISFYYEFDWSGVGTCYSVVWRGYIQAAGDTVGVYLYNWATEEWDLYSTLNGADGTTEVNATLTVASDYNGTGDDLGKLRIKFESSTATKIVTDRIYALYYGDVGDYASCSIHHNLYEYYERYSSHTPGPFLGTDNVVLAEGTNVKWVLGSDPTLGNVDEYKLASDSLAIGAGTTSDADDDYWGNARPQGAAYDIGAHEYTSE